jgi:predicted nucleic acid-binding protein
MIDKILLDTDVVIHLLHQQKGVKECFELYYEQGVAFLLSLIIVAELYAGAFPKEYEAIERFLFSVPAYSIDT